MLAGVILGLAVVPSAMLLDRLPPFAKRVGGDRPPRFIWMDPGVSVGCWMTVSAGAWKSLLDSYVPVILVWADHSDGATGVLVGVANVAVLVGSVGAAMVRRQRTVAGLNTVGTAVGPAVGVASSSTWVVAAALFISGAGAGLLQTLGPALAADAVADELRGDAIALAGIFRSGAFMAAPVGMAAIVAVLPLTAGSLLAGGALLVPVLPLARGPLAGK